MAIYPPTPPHARFHYGDVIMGAMASQITSLTIVYSTVYSGADQRKHQSSAFPAFVRGIRRWPMNSPYKWPVVRKMVPFDAVIMFQYVFYPLQPKARCFVIIGYCVNSSLPGQKGRHFAYDIFRGIFVNEMFCILIKISLKFRPKGLIDNSPALV